MSANLYAASGGAFVAMIPTCCTGLNLDRPLTNTRLERGEPLARRYECHLSVDADAICFTAFARLAMSLPRHPVADRALSCLLRGDGYSKANSVPRNCAAFS